VAAVPSSKAFQERDFVGGGTEVNALFGERCAKVDACKNSNQRQRWLAAALLDIKPRLRCVRGFRHRPKLREALLRELKIDLPNEELNVQHEPRERSGFKFQPTMGLTRWGRRRCQAFAER
jgi:hypothetical protein